MDPTDIGLFRLAEQRLAWIDRRQGVLAQNIANVNTPGYQAQDISPFAAALGAPGLAQTDPGHLAGRSAGAGGGVGHRQKERAPAGNTVAIEDELGKVAETAGAQALVLNLHRSYQTMMRTALGRAG